MSIKLTHEEYLVKLHNINPNIEVVGSYINRKTKIFHRCLIDGYEWEVAPNNLLNGTGCPLCAGKVKTTQTFLTEMNAINENIIILGSYTSAKDKILCKCKIDGHMWHAAPTMLLRGSGCPVCSGVKKKTTSEYVKEVELIHPNILVIGEYINAKTKILHRCTIDDYVWEADPHHILSGRGCPLCNSSKGEKSILNYLKGIGVQFERQYVFPDCKNVFMLPFDFYLPEYNVCIEYDGIQHFQPIDFFGGIDGFKARRKNDLIKTTYCLSQKIPLLRISYDQNVIDVLKVFLSQLII